MASGRYIELALTEKGYADLMRQAEQDGPTAEFLEDAIETTLSERSGARLIEWEDCSWWAPLRRFAREADPEDFLIRQSGDEGAISFEGKFVNNPFIDLEIQVDLRADNPLEEPVRIMADIYGPGKTKALLEDNLEQVKQSGKRAYNVASSNGLIAIDGDGHVVAFEDSWKDADWECVPLRFNMREWRNNSPIGEPESGTIDILDLGFWNVRGEYTAPEMEWRQLQREMSEESAPTP